MDHRCRRGGRDQRWHVGNRRAFTVGSSGKFAGLFVPVWIGNRRTHLFCRFPLMILFIIFCPIIAAILIMAGAPARKTALGAAVLAFAAALFLLAFFDQSQRDFQHITSFTISPEWHLSFTTGIDGLSLVMIVLATIVTLAAVWFTGTIEKYENAFYACLLFFSGGAMG